MTRNDFIWDMVYLGFALAYVALWTGYVFLRLKRLREPRNRAEIIRKIHDGHIRSGAEALWIFDWIEKHPEGSLRFSVMTGIFACFVVIFLMVVLYLNYKQIIK